MCCCCWPQQINPHLKKSVNMHFYWSVGCYSFVTSVNDCCPSPCSNTSSPKLSWFNQCRATKPGQNWCQAFGTGQRTPAGKSLNSRAGQVHSKRKDRGTGRGDNDSHQADRLPGRMLQEHKKWVRRMGNFWRKTKVKGWRTGTCTRAWAMHTPGAMNMYGKTMLCYQVLWILV